jgi:hypothetical protein
MILKIEKSRMFETIDANIFPNSAGTKKKHNFLSIKTGDCVFCLGNY